MIITIPGNPIPKARARTLRSGISYDPQSRIKKYVKADMVLRIMENHQGSYLNDYDCVFSIDMDFHMPIPKSLAKSKANGLLWAFHDKKPDIDNLIKFYFDCGNNIIWSDDSKITSINATKLYSENPRTVIKITRYNMALDKTTEDILSTFSPAEFADLVTLMGELHQRGAQIIIEADSSSREILSKKSSNVLKELATKYSTQLLKVKKIADKGAC